MTKSPSLLLLGILVAGLLHLGAGSLSAADETKEKIVLHTDWKGERIELPPRFAPAMTLKGIEEIRFAPGMFNAKSDSFFTYAFVFSVPKSQELTPEVIQREMLAYYRGLAESVLKSKGKSAAVDKFAFKLEEAKEATGTPEKIPASTKVIQYIGELNWVEPFATAQPQVLHFEIQSWADPVTVRNYLFVCTSPRARGEADVVWKELREIRRTFEVAGQ